MLDYRLIPLAPLLPSPIESEAFKREVEYMRARLKPASELVDKSDPLSGYVADNEKKNKKPKPKPLDGRLIPVPNLEKQQADNEEDIFGYRYKVEVISRKNGKTIRELLEFRFPPMLD
jgi:hypothetical protein